MEFPKKLQTLRKSQGMTQEQLAEAAGVSRQAVSKWEAGQSLPDMEKLILLSGLFRVTLDELVHGEPSPLRQKEPSGEAPEQREAGAPFLSIHINGRFHYERKSSRTLFGIPLYHINLGRGGKRHVAKGLLAVGNLSFGLVSLGFCSFGLISFGLLSVGLLAFGTLALGGLAVGAAAAGLIAIGALAAGAFAIGGLAAGMFSIGGGAAATHLAVGGFASGHIAAGDVVRGDFPIHLPDGRLSEAARAELRRLLEQEFPRLWQPVRTFFQALFG